MHNILVILEYTNITGMMLIGGGRGSCSCILL